MPPVYLVAHPGAELYGSDRVMLESVIGMRAAGAEVVVTLPESGPLEELLRRAGATIEITSTLVLRKSLLRPKNWGRLLALTARGVRSAHRLMREHRPDAVYVSTVTLPLWTVMARLHRRPVLVHLHEAEQGASRFLKRGMYASVLLANEIVVNSEFSRGVLMQAFPALARRARVVYNGVAGPDTYTPVRARLVDSVRLVYLGRLSPRKGPDLIVEALALLADPRVRLDLVGGVFPGYEWFEQKLRDRIVALGLGDRIRLLGFRPSVWASVDDSDIVVVPSRLDEPFGNTAVEGILAGRVVLVSDTSGLREATADVRTAVAFAPDDAAAIASAIGQAITRWGDLEPLLDAEAEAARERYAPDTYRASIAGAMGRLTASN